MSGLTETKNTKSRTDTGGQNERVVMREHTLAKPGDHVFYDGREGKILSLCHIYDGTPALDLEDVDNPEIMCMAKESDCITIDDYWHGSALSKSGIQY